MTAADEAIRKAKQPGRWVDPDLLFRNRELTELCRRLGAIDGKIADLQSLRAAVARDLATVEKLIESAAQ